MHFVNTDGAPQPILLGSALDPFLVVPFEFAIVPDNRRVLGRGLKEEAIRVSLEHQRAMDVFDFVFVEGALAEVWDEDFPDARSAKRTQGVIAPVPIVERAHDTNSLRVGRPHRKAGSRHPIDYANVRAELVINATFVALPEKVEVHFAQGRKKGVSVARS